MKIIMCLWSVMRPMHQPPTIHFWLFDHPWHLGSAKPQISMRADHTFSRPSWKKKRTLALSR
uniref:Uncharacterized protein n=1 Tax=Anguilla anguilla TaxID=7936 RepID=A0A0E9RYE5_ANGAN